MSGWAPSPSTLAHGPGSPGAAAWLRPDALSWVFLALVALVGVAALLYGPSYLGQERYRRHSRARYHPFVALFLAGMAGAVAAWDLVVFVVCWEVMTLASYVLVAFETDEPAATRAAFKYFVMTHAGSACLLLAVMLLWAAGGSFSLGALPASFAALAAHQPAVLHLALGLMFVAFATKAGLFPFGDWLPDAHPAAPAPVSALLSGVMVKLGLYGFLRFFAWDLAAAAPQAAAAWGDVLMTFGAGSITTVGPQYLAL